MAWSFFTLTGTAVVLIALYLSSSVSKLVGLLLSSSIHSQLSFSPKDLTGVDVAAIILTLITRTVAQLLGFEPSLKSHQDGATYTYTKLPPTTISMPMRTTQHEIELYRNAVDLPVSARVQDHTGHLSLFLSAVSEPAMLLLLAKRSFPLNPLGTVNVHNRMELLRPDILTETDLSQLRGTLVASVLEEAKPVKKGLEVDLRVQMVISQAGENVTVFQQTFTILKFMKLDQSMVSIREYPAVVHKDSSNGELESFEMHAEDPWKWAAMCKDYNPIHTSAVMARLLGFKGKLAHGNHTVAKGIECLRRASPLIDQSAWDKISPPTWLEVRFIRPVILPATLRIHQTHSTNSTRMDFVQSELVAIAETGFL